MRVCVCICRDVNETTVAMRCLIIIQYHPPNRTLRTFAMKILLNAAVGVAAIWFIPFSSTERHIKVTS